MDVRIWWTVLERRTGTTFLAAGGALLVNSAVEALDAFSAVSARGGPLLFLEGISGFAGIVLSFVGLAGLSLKLVDEAPWLARVGLALVALPAIVSVTVLVWLLFVAVLSVPWPPGLSDAANEGLSLLFALGFATVGVACLRASVDSSAIGVPVLAIGAAWFLFFGAIPVYSLPVPPWVALVHTGTIAVASLAVGYRLRDDSGVTEGPGSASDPTA